MREVRGNADGGRENRHKNIRSVISALQKHDIPIRNPYGRGGFSAPKSKIREVYLEVHEVEKLHNSLKAFKPFSTKRRALQMFLLACSTGLRISDIQSLRWAEVDLEKGRITKEQQKTKLPISAILPPIAVQSIKEFYEEKQGEDSLVFKFYNQNTLREHLQEIIKLVGIDKKIGYHTGRHTFATLKLQKGTDLATISKLLGHKDIGSTMVYLKMNDNKLLDIHEEAGKSFLSVPKLKKKKKHQKRSK